MYTRRTLKLRALKKSSHFHLKTELKNTKCRLQCDGMLLGFRDKFLVRGQES